MIDSSHYDGSLCPVCHHNSIQTFFELCQVPVHCNILWPSREEAKKAPRGDIKLGFCERCGHIFNISFKLEKTEYSYAYEASLHFSPTFQNYAESLIRELIDRYNLKGKDVIEIGCGRGEFLKMICEIGGNRGTGFDPSYRPPDEKEQPFRVIEDFYSSKYSRQKTDIIICRHVLEHLHDPRRFLLDIRKAVSQRSIPIFFEVPNAMYIFKNLNIWDITYEHVSYFTFHSLRELFTSCDFKVNTVMTRFQEQFITVEAIPCKFSKCLRCDIKNLKLEVEAFSKRYRDKLKEWLKNLKIFKELKKKVVIWGVGSKGVTFLNLIDKEGYIEFGVDINPRKEGKFVAGTGQKIVVPDFLREYNPDVIIVMNPIYKNEIIEKVKYLNITPEIYYLKMDPLIPIRFNQSSSL